MRAASSRAEIAGQMSEAGTYWCRPRCLLARIERVPMLFDTRRWGYASWALCTIDRILTFKAMNLSS